MLSYEIEQAVDVYKIPLIITYVDYQIIANPSHLKSYWPVSLEQRISTSTARAIHIPFMKDAMLDAINQFNLTNQPDTSLNYYTEQAHRTFGCMIYPSSFVNKLKDHS
ncbi:hypothetical protein MJ258_10110 [Legionella sp. EUR-108]|uniref:Uncharacterized protein n=1 Tax=Legionella maioricensis TaxID=2896528 RepID=A0A9X2D0U7_9GAMM|nr:hypothetical protein [Legionella maioricensis]MCL9687871.1 hypothetical protein [Legionella maioricensis]